MFYVGLDIHSKRISICVLNETGQVVHRSQVRTIEEMMRILEGLPDRFEVCYEASCGYGHFHDLLRPLAARVLVAHPGQLAADLPIEEQERSQGRRATGEAAVPGRDADGACALAGRPNLAGTDQLPQPGDRQADAGQEHHSRAAPQRRRDPPEAPRPVDEEGPGLAPPTGPAHGVPATAAGSAPRRDRDAQPPAAAHRTGVESPGPADACRRSTAEHPGRRCPDGRSRGRIRR